MDHRLGEGDHNDGLLSSKIGDDARRLPSKHASQQPLNPQNKQTDKAKAPAYKAAEHPLSELVSRWRRQQKYQVDHQGPTPKAELQRSSELQDVDPQQEQIFRRSAQYGQVTPESLQHLRHLIRIRNQLDREIWKSRNVRFHDRPVVLEKCRQADGVLYEIQSLLSSWHEDAFSESEWEVVSTIKAQLASSFARVWEQDPLWSDTNHPIDSNAAPIELDEASHDARVSEDGMDLVDHAALEEALPQYTSEYLEDPQTDLEIPPKEELRRDAKRPSPPVPPEAPYPGLSTEVLEQLSNVRSGARPVAENVTIAIESARSLIRAIETTSSDQFPLGSFTAISVDDMRQAREQLQDYSKYGSGVLNERMRQKLENTQKELDMAVEIGQRSVDYQAKLQRVAETSPKLLQPVHGDLGHTYISQRIWWTCRCGIQIWDDFIEVTPGSLSRLQEGLKTENHRNSEEGKPHHWLDFVKEAFTSAIPGNKRAAPSDTAQVGTSTAVSGQQITPTSQENKIPSPVMHDQSQSQNSVSASTVTIDSLPPGAASSILYLLLCFPIGLTGLKLHHAQIISRQLTSDYQLFALLRKVYGAEKEAVTFTSKLSLKTVTRVSLSHFLVDLSQFVDLKPHSLICARGDPGCRCIPPVDMISPAPAAEYICEPAQPEYMPPIGVNYLTHLFQNPSHINPNSKRVLQQVPKRMAGQLMAGPEAGWAKGWGLAFEEGWDKRRIGQRVLLLFVLGALLVAALYSAITKDVQSAFAISGCVISALAILGTYLGAGEARTFVLE